MAFELPNRARCTTRTRPRSRLESHPAPRDRVAELAAISSSGDYATQVSAFFDGHTGSAPYSWVFGNDANGDSLARDLAYIPNGINDVVFAGNSTADQQFMDYINNDQYLSSTRARVQAQRCARSVDQTVIDLTFRQEIPGFMAGHKGELRSTSSTSATRSTTSKVERRTSADGRNLADFGGVDPRRGKYIYNIDQQVKGGIPPTTLPPVNESFNPSQRWSVLVTPATRSDAIGS